jgi:hypothetical protein
MFYKDSRMPDPKNPDNIQGIPNPEWGRTKFGWGLQALMMKYIIPEEEREKYLANPKLMGQLFYDYWDVLEKIVNREFSKGPIIDTHKMPIEMQRVVGENAFEARVRAISIYVSNRMLEVGRQQMKGKEVADSALRRGNGENDKDGEMPGKRFVYGDDEYVDTDKFGPMGHEELRTTLGIEGPLPPVPPSNPNATFDGHVERPTPNVIPAATPGRTNPKQAPPMIDDEDELSKYGGEPDDDEDELAKYSGAPTPPTPPPAPKPSPQPRQRKAAQAPARPPVQTPVQPPVQSNIIDDEDELAKYGGEPDDEDELAKYENRKRFSSYMQWLKETEVVYDPRVKPKDGCGFNYWGAPGKLGGVSITGEPDTAKTDPTGKKGSNARKRRR